MKIQTLLFTILVQFALSSDSINVALSSRPFVKFVGSFPVTTVGGEVVTDTSYINPNNLIDNNYFSVIVYPVGPVSNIGSSFGIEMYDSLYISSVSIKYLGNNALYGFRNRIRAFSIYGSKDTLNWFKIFQEKDNYDSTNYLAFTKSNNRWKYLKVVIDSIDKSYFTVISELGVYVSANSTLVDELDNNLPKNIVLLQNYPNPFNPSTRIEYQLTKPGFVSLRVYDYLGREIENLVNEIKMSGVHSIQWNATQHTTGAYFVNMVFENNIITRRVLLIK